MLKTLMIRSAILAFAFAMSVAAHAYAADPKRLDVPAGDLAAALQALAKQSGVELVYQSKQLAGLRTKGLKGAFTPEDAVTKLLEGTPLTFRKDPSGAMLITLPGLNPLSSTEERNGAAEQEGMWAQGPRGNSELRLAQAESSSSQSTAPPEDTRISASESQELPAPGETGKAIPEILVKGSYVLNSDIKRSQDDVQPYVVLDKEDIRRSGASDLQRYLNERLTAGPPATSAQQSLSARGNATTFALRGLGPNETLVLINGRRLASLSISGNAAQPDLGGIPLAAVERVEILPSTASGIFGGGATGGVINVILKQNYTGVDVTASLDNTLNGSASDRRASLNGGFSLEGGKTNVMILASYSEATQLLTEDRDFLVSARERILQNNPSAINDGFLPPLGTTTNICSVDEFSPGVCASALGLDIPLTLRNGQSLGSDITSVPINYAGAATDGGMAFLANAGTYNQGLANTAQSAGGGKEALVNGPQQMSASATIRRSFSENVEAFAEFAVSENEGSFAYNSNLNTYTLDPTVPTNPFQQTIQITTPAFGLDDANRSKTTSRRALAGVSLRLGEDWDLVGEYSWSESKFSTVGAVIAEFPAGGAEVAAGTIDLLRDTNLFPVDFSPYALGSESFGPARTTLSNPSLRLGGLLPIDLPGGQPSLTALAEYRQEELDDAYFIPPNSNSFVFPARHRSTRSGYLESRVPIVSERNRLPALEQFELQLAARYDHYETETFNFVPLTPNPPPAVARRSTLSSTDPTFGARYSPLEGITFRASYGTGFLPPSLTQLIPGSRLTINAGTRFRDPQRGNEFVTGQIVLATGGNPDLLPEQAESWNYGVVLAPSFVPGLRISIDHMELTKRDNIASLGGQNAINNELFLPSLVTRAAATPQNDPNGYGVGPITGINQTLFNFANADIRAVDAVVDYTLPSTELGQGRIALRGTRMLQNSRRVTPTSTPTEFLETLGSLKWIANASLSWEFDAWSAGWQTFYYDRYFLNTAHAVVPEQGSATIPSQIYHDMYIAYGKGSDEGATAMGERLLSGLSVQFGIKNVFNSEPPIDVTDEFGYSSSIGDPRLTRYYVSIQKSF